MKLFQELPVRVGEKQAPRCFLYLSLGEHCVVKQHQQKWTLDRGGFWWEEQHPAGNLI